MSDIKIVSIRDNPEMLDRAVDYYSSKWGISEKIYRNSMESSLNTQSPLPCFYLLLDGKKIIGSYALITNDFNSRQDLWPWLAALYVEAEYRGKSLGAMLLKNGADEARRLGFQKLYLLTDHIGYYEKYGWVYLGNGFGVDGEESRIYEISTGNVTKE